MHFSVLFNLGGLLLLLSLLIYDRLYGWEGSFYPEQNHNPKPNCMLNVYHFDDNGPDYFSGFHFSSLNKHYENPNRQNFKMDQCTNNK